MAEKIIIGCFVEATCCTDCDWFGLPFLLNYGRMLPPPPRTICPRCGGTISEMAGQYKIKETKSFWTRTVTEYVGFIRKKKQTEQPINTNDDLVVCPCPICAIVQLVKSPDQELNKTAQCEHCKSILILRHETLEDPEYPDDDGFYYELVSEYNQPEQP